MRYARGGECGYAGAVEERWWRERERERERERKELFSFLILILFV